MAKQMIVNVAEQNRLNDAREAGISWKKWGPYLSERQWGTVREDYSENGDAWGYFPHDQARSRAYRWGEDGLAGISDDQQQTRRTQMPSKQETRRTPKANATAEKGGERWTLRNISTQKACSS